MSVAREVAAPSRLPTPQAEDAPVSSDEQLDVLWLASALVVPVALVFAVGVAVVAQVTPQGGPAGLEFLPGAELRPEAGEQRAYLLLLLAPLALAAAVVTLTRRRESLSSRPIAGWLVAAAFSGQLVLVSLVLVSMWVQQDIAAYFDLWQLGLSLLLGLGAAAAVVTAYGSGVREAAAWLSATAKQGPVPSGIAATVAVFATVAYVSTTVFRDGNIANAPIEIPYHLAFTSEEFAAVLGGRTPLVDFVPQYVSLLPYLAAPIFSLTGFSITSMTLLFATLSGFALLSVFLAFWKVTGRAVLAVLFYVPFLSITFYPADRDGAELSSVGSYYAVLPLRYFFPLVLTALVAVFAPRAREWRPALILGLMAGAGLVNNVEFGIAGLGAVFVAVFVGALSTGPTTGRWLDAVVAEARLLAGVAAAVLLFVVGTLLRSGSLPDFGQLLYFSRLFAASGYNLFPIPGPLGLHLVMYLTGALALVLALVCAARRSVRAGPGGPAGLALLGYSSVFGLGAASYYVGRSHPLVLIAIFCAWALCSATLTIEVLGRLPGIIDGGLRTRMLCAIPAAALVGLSVLFTTTLSGADVVAGQPGRLSAADAPKIFAARDMRAFVSDCTVPGESVMLMSPLGHWIAADAGLQNYLPYNQAASVVTRQQVSVVAAGLRKHDVTSVFLGTFENPNTEQALKSALAAAGYERGLQVPPSLPAKQASVAGGRMELWRRPMTPGPCS